MMRRVKYWISVMLLATMFVCCAGGGAQAAAIIIEDDTLPEASPETGDVRGGTSQDDAVLVPLNTKIYGEVTKDQFYHWLAFTTGSNPDTTYFFTTINKEGDFSLVTEVFDAYGTKIVNGKAGGKKGIASTFAVEDLAPDTVYYLQVHPEFNKDDIHFMLRIRTSDEQAAGYNTTGNMTEARGDSAAAEGMIYPGANQDDAGFLPLNVKIGGTIREEAVNTWFAFTTNEVTDAVYRISTVNTTGDYRLETEVFDDYGNKIGGGIAKGDGVASTLELDKLQPNTTYYLYMHPEQNAYTIDYTLSIEAPEPPAPETAPAEAVEQEPLVFETPFELGETQVMFKAESDEFVNPEAAQAALQPVADVILAHPDHAILLAGTTATDGDQANRVELSNRRAAAVKRVLVDVYGVPEAQLLTVGLGYAADPFVRGVDRIPAGDPSGKFVETEGAKNRRVVVMDAEDPIAKQILGQ